MTEHTTTHDNTVQPAGSRRWSSTREAAQALGMHAQTLRKMALAGKVPAIRKGRHFAFEIEKVAEALSI